MKMLGFMCGLCVFLSSQAWADATQSPDEAFSTQAGETIYNAKEMIACTLVHASFKSSGGFFSRKEDKSLEAYCHTRSGEVFRFSAEADQLKNLHQHAGREVLIFFSSQKKLENAQTDKIMLDTQPIDGMNGELQALCAPPPGKQLYDDEEVWARGFRMAQMYFSKHSEDGWMLHLLEGKRGDTVWGKDINVQLGRFCNGHLHDAIKLHEPLIYGYVQREEKKTYYIEAIHRLVLTPAKNP